MTCLLGSNGAGKTTMMRILCGLDSRYRGAVTLEEVLKEGTGEEEGVDFGAGDDGEDAGHDDDDDDDDDGGALSFIASLCTAAFWIELVGGLLTGRVTIHPPLHGHTRDGGGGGGQRRVRRCIGWCSQEDAVFDYLTVREHMELFQALLGHATTPATATTTSSASGSATRSATRSATATATTITTATTTTTASTAATSTAAATVETRPDCLAADAAAPSVEESLRRLGMAEHAHKMACALSGGMRRRLTLGLAFAGGRRVH